MSKRQQASAQVSRSTYPHVLIIIFLLLALSISIGGYGYYLSVQKVVKDRAGRQLSAVADLKVGQIDSWRKELYHDAEVIRSNSFFIEHISHQVDPRVKSYMRAIIQQYGYRSLTLLQPDGTAVQSVGIRTNEVDAVATNLVLRAAKSGRTTLSGFRKINDPGGRNPQRIQLDMAIPLVLTGHQPSRPVAVALVAIDPNVFIYPLIQTWPGVSPSAETLLIRREDDKVVFLNELRHRKGAALALSFPISQVTLPAVMAAKGEQGIVEGLDYRGKRVLAAVRRVPDSPWFMVSKVDSREVYAPLEEKARLVAIVSILLMLAAAGAVHGFWYYQKAEMTRRAETELRKLNNELEQHVQERTAQLEKNRQRLEAVNRELEAFAYSVSHDLRSPLRGIDGYSKILLEDYLDLLDDDGRFILGQVRSSANEMGELIDDLLEYSRLGRCPLKLGRVNMRAICEQVCEEIRRDVPERNLELQMGALPVVTGDALLLRGVVRNLLANAVKFTAARDPAFISIGTLNGQATGSETTFFIRDNGTGFDMRYAHKLFGVFQRLHSHEEFPGSGVGLANVKRIVDRHGGRVWAEGEPEAGAVFYFTIPEQHTRTKAK